ncbi:zf-HC2 domain-containing protein [bacterium]|nr:zf-HC2 domain-containing protein [bacterium]
MDCHKFDRILSLYIDRQLSSEEQHYWDEHLKTCQRCRTKVRQTRELVSLLADLPQYSPSLDFHRDLRNRLVQETKTKMRPFGLRWLQPNIAGFTVFLCLLLLCGTMFYNLREQGLSYPAPEIQDQTLSGRHTPYSGKSFELQEAASPSSSEPAQSPAVTKSEKSVTGLDGTATRPDDTDRDAKTIRSELTLPSAATLAPAKEIAPKSKGEAKLHMYADAENVSIGAATTGFDTGSTLSAEEDGTSEYKVDSKDTQQVSIDESSEIDSLHTVSKKTARSRSAYYADKAKEDAGNAPRGAISKPVPAEYREVETETSEDFESSIEESIPEFMPLESDMTAPILLEGDPITIIETSLEEQYVRSIRCVLALTERGSVVDVTLPDNDLTAEQWQQVRTQLKKWTFTPAYRGETALKVWFERTLEIAFTPVPTDQTKTD